MTAFKQEWAFILNVIVLLLHHHHHSVLMVMMQYQRCPGSVQLTAELFYNKEDAEVDYDDDMLVMMKRNVEVQWGR